jgi:hypothetical protein
MSERVLYVDDEQNVLDGIQHSMRKHITLRAIKIAVRATGCAP